VPLPRSRLDLTQPATVRGVVEKLRPQVVINCAAWTAVDAAESDPAACRLVNADAVGELAAACNAIAATLVQVSTDYVFGADATRTTPYTETDAPGPVNEYGASKLAGEQAAATATGHLVVRTCGLYSAGDQGPVRGRNFADTMLALAAERDELRIVDDQHCTPSFVPHVARGILRLLDRGATGLFHVVNAGSTTWHGFATELFRVAGLPMTLHPISTSEYPTPAMRPGYSVLDPGKFSEVTGDALPVWQTGIAEYVRAVRAASSTRERTPCSQFS
jgi:dTDP-4-dehydrorhamnose reductase